MSTSYHYELSATGTTPATLQDLNGRNVVTTHPGDRWTFRGFVNSPDPRFRQIVKRFADAGYLDAERDEFAKSNV